MPASKRRARAKSAAKDEAQNMSAAEPAQDKSQGAPSGTGRPEDFALLAAIVESSSDAIYSVSPDGLITSWNAGAERLYGYSAPEAIGHPKSLTVPPDRTSEAALIDARARAGERVAPMETVRVARDGRRLDVSLSVSPIRDADGKIVSISIIARDITDRKRADLQRVMMMELNHRVKNSLAVVSAMARRTLRNSQSPDAFVGAFERRLKAFGRTHNALSEENWQGLPLKQLATAELQPYMSENYERARISGPPILLTPKAAIALGMTVHELASNAMKYGSLSSTGRVDVAWELTGATPTPILALRWTESGGPKVAAPKNPGLGHRLIKEMPEYELGATVTLNFEPTGVQCRIEMPLTPDVGAVLPAVDLPESGA